MSKPPPPTPLETHPVEFDWHRQSWSIRPAESLRPHNGEYFIQKYTAITTIPMNLRYLCLYLGITPPAQPFPLRTLATFFELTAKVTHLTLPTILQNANLLRPHPPSIK